MWQFQGIYDGEEKILIIMKKDINYNSYSILAFIFLKLMSVSVQKKIKIKTCSSRVGRLLCFH